MTRTSKDFEAMDKRIQLYHGVEPDVLLDMATHDGANWAARMAAVRLLVDTVLYEADGLTDEWLDEILGYLQRTPAVSDEDLSNEFKALAMVIMNETAKRKDANTCSICGGDLRVGSHGIQRAVDDYICKPGR